ncbi:hypothetical protein RSAG8_06929, partial [Rhizoctonia solani AG-8 WAC10335]
MNTPISGAMPVGQILALFRDRGCEDMSSKLDLPNISPIPTSCGGQGDIYKGKLTDGKEVAIKVIRMAVPSNSGGGEKKLQQVAHELYIWTKCKHRNILELFGMAIFHDNLAMISPWIDNSTLDWFISQNPQVDRYGLCAQVAEAIAYMHIQHIVHGDIKCGNILVSRDHVVKIMDFGSSTLKREYTLKVKASGESAYSLRWAAPELLNIDEERKFEADIYALGMTFLEIMSGEVPYHKADIIRVMRLIMHHTLPKRPEHMIVGDAQADLLWLLMEDTWAKDPQDRPGANVVRDRINAISDRDQSSQGERKSDEHNIKEEEERHEPSHSSPLPSTVLDPRIHYDRNQTKPAISPVICTATPGDETIGKPRKPSNFQPTHSTISAVTYVRPPHPHLKTISRQRDSVAFPPKLSVLPAVNISIPARAPSPSPPTTPLSEQSYYDAEEYFLSHASPDEDGNGFYDRHEEPSEQHKPVKKALVGINYMTWDKDKRLYYAVNDAKLWRDSFVGKGMEPESIKIVTDDGDMRDAPTFNALLGYIRWLVRGATAGDSLFFVWCLGHATLTPNYGPSILTADKRIFPRPLLEKELVMSVPAGVELQVVFDCCHSGGMVGLQYCVGRMLKPTPLSDSHAKPTTRLAECQPTKSQGSNTRGRRYCVGRMLKPTPLSDSHAEPTTRLAERQPAKSQGSNQPAPFSHNPQHPSLYGVVTPRHPIAAGNQLGAAVGALRYLGVLIGIGSSSVPIPIPAQTQTQTSSELPIATTIRTRQVPVEGARMPNYLEERTEGFVTPAGKTVWASAGESQIAFESYAGAPHGVLTKAMCAAFERISTRRDLWSYLVQEIETENNKRAKRDANRSIGERPLPSSRIQHAELWVSQAHLPPTQPSATPVLDQPIL